MTPLLLALAALSPAQPATPPNVVLVIADDLGADDCGPFGNRVVRTPNLDRLARAGMRFDRAFVPASSCSPSRCSLISGRYPHSHGAPRLHQPLPAGQPNLAALLRAAGYWTAIAGKTHLGQDALAGFDVVNAGGGPSGCGQWVATLRQRPMTRPFFAWLAALDPHRDYQPNTIPEPHRPADVVVPPYLPDTPEVRADLALYYDEVSRLDRFVGDVLDELDRQGVANNTLVLFLSDNGRPFPRCKTTLYDSGCRTPLIARWPVGGVRAGSTAGALVNTIDIAPTLLGLAGAPVPAAVQGRSFAAVLRDPAAEHRDYVFLEKNWHDFDDHARAVRSARFRYVRNSYLDVPMTPPADAVRSPTFQAMLKLHDAGRLPPEQRSCFPTPRPAEELYDLDADPHELRNVVADPRHTEALRAHRAALDEWVKETGDQVPVMRTPDGFDRRTGRPVKK